MQNIPIIDLRAFREVGPAAFDTAAIDKSALVEACEDHGFFLSVNHGCDAQVRGVFAAAADFFAMPRSQKIAVYRDAENPLGYYLSLIHI